MVVHYRKAVAAVILGLGLVNLVLVVVLLGLGARTPYGSLVAGAACLLLGTLYFVRPYFRLVDGAFEVPALIGPLRRTYAFAAPEDVQYRDGRFWVTEGGKTRKVPVARWLAHPADWNALHQHLHLAQLD